MAKTVIHRTIPDQIADQLRLEILSGRLVPGQALREQEVSERYGVSRGPVREVFRQLTQQGLLMREPNKGARVAHQPSASVRPLVVELRKTIELFVLEATFESITEEKVAELDGILQDIEKACKSDDTTGLVEHDLRFHRAILTTYNDEDILALWQPIVMRMLIHYTRHGDLMDSYDEHKRILDEIKKGDKEAALAALVANLQ